MHAAGAGVTALMVVPPFYDAVSIPQLHELLGQIRDSTGLPLMYYHIPSATGTKLSTEQLAHLSEAGVRYVKYTSEDAIGLMEMLYERGDSVVTFGGMDTLMFDAVAAGAQGVVWGLANVVPDLCLQFWDAVAVQGDLARGRQLWAKLWPLCKFFESVGYAAAVKTSMELLGRPTGGMRKPFALLHDVQRIELEKHLVKAGVQTKTQNGHGDCHR